MGSLWRRRCRCSATAIAAAALCAGDVRSANAWSVHSCRHIRPAAFPTAHYNALQCGSSFGNRTRRKRSSDCNALQCGSSFGRTRSTAMMTAKDDNIVSTGSSTSSLEPRCSNRIGGRRLSAIDSKAPIQPTPSNTDVARTAIVITAATVLSVLLVDDITMRFETVQDWRYAWPLVGTLYVVTGMSSWFGASNDERIGTSDNSGVAGWLGTLKDSTDQLASIVPLTSNRWVRGLAAVAGIGVLVGGFIDAFFPVWFTSPDLLGTRAGIEADSAAILLVLTVGGIASNIDEYCSLTLSKKNEGRDSTFIDSSVLATNDGDDGRNDQEANALDLPSWTLAVVLCTQLWEIASATFYSWGELLGVVS